LAATALFEWTWRTAKNLLARQLPAALLPLRGERWLEYRRPDVSATLSKNNWLAKHAKVVTSQDGEDGTIAKIFEVLGVKSGWCVEFGAWDGHRDSNTWNLVKNLGWKAVYIEPHPDGFAALKRNYADVADVHCINDIIEVEGPRSLDATLARTPLPKEFDFLVIDVDGMDYFIWRSLQNYRPKIVSIEFNRYIQADVNFHKWNNEQVEASASLAALADLAKEKGYDLIAVVGNNAFMARADLYPKFNIPDNRPISMFQNMRETKLFQGYDGNLFLTGHRHFFWRHQIDEKGHFDVIEIHDEDVQVLPKGLRVFRPRLSYRNSFLEAEADRFDPEKCPANKLLAFRSRVTSEGGEDGIIQKIFELIGPRNKYCVEVGAHDGKAFSNTWSLIKAGWGAALIEKDPEAFAKLTDLHGSNRSVTALHAEAGTKGPASLRALLGKAGAPRDLDFLCIDVEGNDYSLWAALNGWRPRLVMVDFNPTVSNDVIFAQPDNALLHHGASLRAFIELAKLKGYELAATTKWNAFFVVKEEFAKLGLASNDIDEMYDASLETRVFQSLDNYLSLVGCKRLVRHNYVIDEDHFQPCSASVRRVPYSTGDLHVSRSTFFFSPDAIE
jgi:hypothetical protein